MLFFFPKKLLLLLFLLPFSSASTSEEDSLFKSDCGNATVENPKSSDCYEAPSKNDEKLCCRLTGILGIKERSACVLLENKSAVRINKIKEINKFATKVNLDCGIEKEFESDCGKKNPQNEKDCDLNDNENGQCCLIDIKTKDKKKFKFCKYFENKLDINTIGDAVVAANTIDVDLTVNCFGMKIKMNSFLYLIIIILLLF